ncbi:MAG: hypothetical protein EOO38_17115 [Cytophagaceae bacterium]|nr:MAG: hypothetical protein EOO38_17115 [Cytophagaceae bacterium]
MAAGAAVRDAALTTGPLPAVPGFPGDLKADDALATRAIMEFQYFSINRGRSAYSGTATFCRQGCADAVAAEEGVTGKKVLLLKFEF